MSASLIDTNAFLSLIGFDYPSDFRASVGGRKLELSTEAGYDVGTPTTVDRILDQRIPTELLQKVSLDRFQALRETGTLIYLAEGPPLIDDMFGNHLFGELIRFNQRMHGESIRPEINYPLLLTYCKANKLSDLTRDRLVETIKAHRLEISPSERQFVNYHSFQVN